MNENGGKSFDKRAKGNEHVLMTKNACILARVNCVKNAVGGNE